MRFLPIKGQGIRNDKTRSIVRKRLAFHIWLKVHEKSIDTNMINIQHTIDAFGGLTFADIVLRTTNNDDQRVFSHFNRAWSRDPTKPRWALSVRSHLQDSAYSVFANLKDALYDKYGPDIEQFFDDQRPSQNWKEALVSNQQQQDEEDDWFEDDDDIDEVVKKGFVDSTFLQFFKGTSDQEEDKQSVASWGTGNTAYTEIVTTQGPTGTVNSSITQDTPPLSAEEIDKKKSIVRVRLIMKVVDEDDIEDMLDNKEPYELAFSGINLQTWDPDKEVLMLLAIRTQLAPRSNTKNDHE